MPTIDWKTLGFSKTQVKCAQDAAEDYFGDNPPVWKDQKGYDLKYNIVKEYIEHLRQSNNSIVAEKMEVLDDFEPIFELLRVKIKQIRAQVKKKSQTSQVVTQEQQTNINSGSEEKNEHTQESV